MILEKLLGKDPKGLKYRCRNKSLRVIYRLVQKHLAEIEEAFARGYTWEQIDEACRISWQKESKAALGIKWWPSGKLIEHGHKVVKKAQAIGKKAHEARA